LSARGIDAYVRGMNARLTILLSGVALLAVAPLCAQSEILLNQLPGPARRTLDRTAPDAPVNKITRHAADGRVFYLVELEQDNALNPSLRIAENGELLPDAPAPSRTQGSGSPLALDPSTPADYDPVISLQHLPNAARQTVLREARGRPIATVDENVSDGRTIYEVEFRSEGRNPRIRVAEDGSLLPAAR
jgi:uncharacterized membrane protein YkoI